MKESLSKFTIKNTSELLAIRSGGFGNPRIGADLSKYIKYSLTKNTGVVEHIGSDHVYCQTNQLFYLVENINEFDIDNETSVLLVGGSDGKLSKHSILSNFIRLRKYFNKIYFEGKNVECNFVSILPNCLNKKYMTKNNCKKIVNIINNPIKKTKLIGTAFGAFSKRQNSFNKNRVHLRKICDEFNLIENFYCDWKEYWERLSEYQFFVSPEGIGNQCTKMYEAILTNTIVIAMNTFANYELKSKYNFPILLVNSWNDINETMLLHALDGEFKNYDWTSTKQLFTINGFSKQILKCNI
jgi:hypothetical protein